MKVEKKTIKKGSCNFCDRGILSENECGLIYTYSHVYELESEQNGGVRVRMCDKCFNEFAKKASELNSECESVKRIKVVVKTEMEGSECEDFLEVAEDSTEELIEIEAKEVAMNMIEWWYEEINE